MASAALLVLAMLALSAAASSPLVLACDSSCTPAAGTPSTGTGTGTPAITLPSLPNIGLPIGIGSVVTPVVGAATPAIGAITPAIGAVTPAIGAITPAIGAVTPAIGAITPAIGGAPKYSSSPKISHGGRKGKAGCAPPASSPSTSSTCPIDALKLGACVDLLGNELHIGDKSVQCCPLVKGVAGLSAAACLCTALKAKVLDLSVYVPIALNLLLSCGTAVPSGYTCA